MTNREALLSKINLSVSPASVETALLDQEIVPDEDYNPKDKDNRRGVDLALAALILVFQIQGSAEAELANDH